MWICNQISFKIDSGSLAVLIQACSAVFFFNLQIITKISLCLRLYLYIGGVGILVLLSAALIERHWRSILNQPHKHSLSFQVRPRQLEARFFSARQVFQIIFFLCHYHKSIRNILLHSVWAILRTKQNKCSTIKELYI